MANLRRHFNFSTKLSSIGPQSAGNTQDLAVQFDKHNLMKNICACLDICGSYIQALNSLCGAGSLLARSLLQTVQNVPVYQNVAQQFLCTWDDVGKATAGASAAVKTETLMVLQEVLNTLEMGSNDSNVDNSISDSFQVIGSCLHSFIELQAQFSMSTWKSLSKLSKSFSNDAFMHPLNWKSHERNALKVAKNSELCSTIKKHYSHLVHKYEMQKGVDSIEVPQSPLYISTGINNNNHKLIANHQCTSQTDKVDHSPTAVVWSPSTTLWSTSTDVENDALPSNPLHRGKARASSSSSSSVTPTELDEVINLLSCMPLDQPRPLSPQASPEHRGYDPPSSYQVWSPETGPVLPRPVDHHRPWPECNRDINFGYDSWIWRTDNTNPAELPNFAFGDKRSNSSWDHNRWSVGAGESSSDDTSSNHGHEVDSLSSQSFFSTIRTRRYSSSDGLSDAVENLPDAEDRLWNVQNHKTSTWPLKQSSSRFNTGLDWSEGLSPSKCIPLFYSPAS